MVIWDWTLERRSRSPDPPHNLNGPERLEEEDVRALREVPKENLGG